MQCELVCTRSVRHCKIRDETGLEIVERHHSDILAHVQASVMAMCVGAWVRAGVGVDVWCMYDTHASTHAHTLTPACVFINKHTHTNKHIHTHIHTLPHRAVGREATKTASIT